MQPKVDPPEPTPTREEAPCPRPQGWGGHGQAPLGEGGYSLKGNRKRFTGAPHPDRDAQFEQIEAKKKEFLENADPIVSVDTKKKERVGNFKNAGRTWRSKPDEVNEHDFRIDAD